MVLVASTMLPLGTVAPDFQLPDVRSGDLITLETLADRTVLVVMFICQHCPFVQHVAAELARLGHDYADQSVGIVAISANDVTTHPQDSPAHLQAMAEQFGFTFPVCYDQTQAVAKAFTAACTPDFFVFDRDRRLVYRGQLDDSRPSNGLPVTGADLRGAIAAVLAGQPVPSAQKPSLGCNIKWSPGQAPVYLT